MERKRRLSKKLALISVTFSLVLLFIWSCIPSTTSKNNGPSGTGKPDSPGLTEDQARAITDEILERKSKTILFWNSMFSRADWWLGFGFEPFAGCAYNNCYITNRKDLLPVEEFDAIVFHAVEFRADNKSAKPPKRLPNQVYVFGCQESPINSHTDHMNGSKGFYNWTMTYRLDSDVVFPYDVIEKGETLYRPPSVEEIGKRKKTAAWMVSNCDTQSKREDVFSKLRKLVEIDVYGRCGDHVCSRDNNPEKCYDVLEQNYKFYLSFENSLCKDYVTEKLYNILKRNLVPIVYGGANYSQLAPPNSVINLRDFHSMEELVEFLKYLDYHPEEYLKYFEWKRHYSVKGSGVRNLVLCSLCQKLNQPIDKKTYGDIVEWWKGKDSDKCFDPQL